MSYGSICLVLKSYLPLLRDPYTNKEIFSQQDIECNQTTVTQKWFLHHSWDEWQIVKSPYSLGMSPIEYLWDLVKRPLHTKDSAHITIRYVWIAIEMARIKISLLILWPLVKSKLLRCCFSTIWVYLKSKIRIFLLIHQAGVFLSRWCPCWSKLVQGPDPNNKTKILMYNTVRLKC